MSTKFIWPSNTVNCVASFIFMMTARGTVEINMYVEPAPNVNQGDQVSIAANEIRDGESDATVGQYMLVPGQDPNFVPGWRVLSFTLTGSGSFRGYITMLGVSNPDSIVLIDSFRYIPPGYDGECNIYEEPVQETTITLEDTTTTTEMTTTILDDKTTTTNTFEDTTTTLEMSTTTIEDITTTPIKRQPQHQKHQL
ncbi:unnamed protein product [Leptidea sinapis]|uniref:Uncharacterized protein n=1 Tax=Leptidea sinapis TaxID=189913 RepID=A0A5E4R3C1_9NEOP|nr:unnamed protein product [Leptidea sinapis]